MMSSAGKMVVVISQPMFFPWVGMFEQIRLADVMVHYDDVKLSKGSFVPRVQVKTEKGTDWLSAPVDHKASGKMINESRFRMDVDWRASHLAALLHHYAEAPHLSIMMDLASELYAAPGENLADFNCHALERVSKWLGLTPRFYRSSELNIGGKSSERVRDICAHFDADIYVTGLGAADYLDFRIFEERNIEVRFMQYEKRPYPQLHGEFTPFVSILDAVANCGEDAAKLLCSNTIHWKDYLNGSR